MSESLNHYCRLYGESVDRVSDEQRIQESLKLAILHEVHQLPWVGSLSALAEMCVNPEPTQEDFMHILKMFFFADVNDWVIKETSVIRRLDMAYEISFTVDSVMKFFKRTFLLKVPIITELNSSTMDDYDMGRLKLYVYQMEELQYLTSSYYPHHIHTAINRYLTPKPV